MTNLLEKLLELAVNLTLNLTDLLMNWNGYELQMAGLLVGASQVYFHSLQHWMQQDLKSWEQLH